MDITGLYWAMLWNNRQYWVILFNILMSIIISQVIVVANDFKSDCDKHEGIIEQAFARYEETKSDWTK